jgi:pyridoxine 4-dehydrogenase
MTLEPTAAAAAGTLRIGDLEQSRIGFGAMRLIGRPDIWGQPVDAAGARDVLRRAVELGVTFIDTAHAYGPETNERLIGEALDPYREGLCIATKAGTRRDGPSDWHADGRPEALRADCERSLRLLRVERIDLLQLHEVDPDVPIEESVGTLAQLQAEGKVRSVGVSNVDADQLARARSVAEIVSVQNRYNVSDRSSDGILEVCERDGLAFIPWFPLGAGAAGEHTALAEIAQRREVTPHQIAIAWLLQRSPAMLPIPGTTSIAHLEMNVAAATIELDDDELRALGPAAA